MFNRLQSRMANRRIVKQREDAERAQALLREFIAGGGAMNGETIEAVVKSDRPAVLEILAKMDPTFVHRALTFSQEGEDSTLR